MRLWHIDLIPYLPKSQLLAQWRELNSIFKKQDKHILINYVYDYPKDYLMTYSMKVIREMIKRNYRVNYINFDNYFIVGTDMFSPYFSELEETFKEHNKEYLTICYWNLREKYLRGQKDFTDEVWQKLDTFYKENI